MPLNADLFLLKKSSAYLSFNYKSVADLSISLNASWIDAVNIGEFTVYVSAAELTMFIISSYVVSVKYDAPTKEAGADLFPNASGSNEFIVDVVVPGVFCRGVLYVNERLEFSNDGT
jgi:hypothetical protein